MKKLLIFFALLVSFLAGCSSGGNCAPNDNDNSANPVQIGTLPNGSAVYLSNNNLPVTESTPTTATIYLVGGSANESYTVNFVSSKLQAKRLASANQYAVESNGISVTPNPCVIGTAGSGYPSSCQVSIAVSSSTYPGTYNVTPTASSSNGNPTELSPITVLVSGSILPSTKAITSFSLNNTAGVITGNNIAVTMPSDTNPSALVATYITTGVAVSVGSVTQTNGVTANNFTSPVKYTVHAADGSTQDYTVTVSVASSSAKAITTFSLNGTAGTITNTTISVIMPYGTDLSSLVATFTTTGQNVMIGSTPQVSGVTANNFTGNLIYTVHAADGSTQDYTVHVTTALNDAKELIQFSLDGTMGAINQVDKTITVTMPYGTNKTALTASFITTGESVTVDTALQTSGVTPNDFTNPVTYTVHAADGSTQNYTVTVTVALNDAKELIQFSLDGTMGAINQVDKTITVAMPHGTSKIALTASFITTGESVTVDTALQTSGVTPNDFTDPVTYTVHAADGSTQNYLVTVTVQPIITQATGITFSGESAFLTSNESSTITQCSVNDSGVLSNCVNLNLGSLLPNGALSISIAESSVTSYATIIGNGATDGANPIVVSCPIVNGTLNVLSCTSTNISPPPAGLNASLRTMQTTNLTTPVLSSDLITSYSIKVKDGEIMTGVINQTAKSIRVTVPYGVSLTNLVASFTVNGAKTTVTVNNVTQLSGVTANDFSSDLLYAVTPSGGSTVYYSVSVQNSTFAASALNTKNWTETILFSYMPWFVTEQPFNPSAAYGYYKESAPFNMMGLSSIAYTPLNATAQAPMYTLTNIESSLTYSCDMANITNIDITKCVSTNYINHPSSIAFVMPGSNNTIYYVASYSDNKLIPCAYSGSGPISCGTNDLTGNLPEISSNVGLNYPRGMSSKLNRTTLVELLTVVNEGDNSYVSCKIGVTASPPTYSCTKYYFKDLL